MLNSTTITNSELQKNIARRFHFEREKAGLSLDELADKIRLTKPTVWKWEKGWKSPQKNITNQIPPIDILGDLCSIYKCSREYLLYETDERTPERKNTFEKTGLSEDALTSLYFLKNYIFNSIYVEGTYNSIDQFLLPHAFMDYTIQHIEDLFFPFARKYELIRLSKELDEDPQKELLTTIFDYIKHEAYYRSDPMYYDREQSVKISISHWIKQNKKTIKNHLKKGYSEDDIQVFTNQLCKNLLYYWVSLDTASQNKIDFELQNTFVIMIRDFFNSFDNLEALIGRYQTLLSTYPEEESIVSELHIELVKNNKN